MYSTVLIWINRLFGVACTFVLQIHLNKSVRYSFFSFLLRWRDALFHKCTVKIVESQTSIILQQRIYKHSFWLSKSIHTNVRVHVRYIIKIKLIKLNSLNICCLFINIMSRLSIAQFFYFYFFQLMNWIDRSSWKIIAHTKCYCSLPSNLAKDLTLILEHIAINKIFLYYWDFLVNKNKNFKYHIVHILSFHILECLKVKYFYY